MSKRSLTRSSLILLAIFLCLSGCAAPNKQLSKADLQSVSSIRVVRVSPPPLLKETIASQAVAMTGIMFGAIGGGIGGGLNYKMMESAGKEVQEKCSLPDLSDLVLKKLVERIPKEVDRWPEMIVESDPVSEDYNNSSGHSLFIRVNLLKIKNGTGFMSVVVAQLQDAEKKVLWQKIFQYESSKFGRNGDLKKLEADNGRHLREEYEFAAEKAASTFIEDLRGGQT